MTEYHWELTYGVDGCSDVKALTFGGGVCPSKAIGFMMGVFRVPFQHCVLCQSLR